MDQKDALMCLWEVCWYGEMMKMLLFIVHFSVKYRFNHLYRSELVHRKMGNHRDGNVAP